MAISQKQLESLKDKNNAILIPSLPFEREIAINFLQANAPEVIEQERYFEELYLSSLHAQMKLVCVFRSNRRPAKRWYRGPDGQLIDESRPEKELMDEMRVTQPMTPTFTKEAPTKPPKLNAAKFLEEMGVELMQRYGLRLDFVDKGQQQPQVLQLSWT